MDNYNKIELRGDWQVSNLNINNDKQNIEIIIWNFLLF